jgi:tetratricopeptide (TPR) repeat protein
MARKKKIQPVKKNMAAATVEPVATPKFFFTATDPGRKLQKRFGLFIALFAFLLYAQSIFFSYTLDDHPAIDQNKYTTQGFAGIATLLKTDYWYGFQDALRGPVYRPTSLVMFAIEWQLFPHHPGVNHFMNVLLFALTCWLLFSVLCRLNFSFPVTVGPGAGLLFATVVTLLYTAHPIHTEVVNNIKSRDEINCFLFGLLSIFFLLNYIQKKLVAGLVLSGLCFLLSVLSKETGIGFLIIIPLVLFTGTTASRKLIIRATAMLLVFSVIYFLLRTEALRHVPVNANLQSPLNNSLYAAEDLMSRMATAFFILLKYLFLLVFPHPLTSDYNYSQVAIQTMSSPAALLGMSVYVLAGIYALVKIRKKNILAFAILFYLVSLAPVSNIFFLGGSTMAERFMYIPSLGFCMAVAYFITRFISRAGQQKKPSATETHKRYKRVMMVLSVLLLLYSIKTIERSSHWKNQLTIYREDAKTSANSASAHFSFGVALLGVQYPEETDPVEKNRILDQSIEEISRAIEIYKDAPIYYVKLGQAYLAKHDNPNAIKNLEKGLLHLPYAGQQDYFILGDAYMQEKQFDKAAEVYGMAIEKDTSSAGGYYNKGTALLKGNRFEEAIVTFQKALAIKPAFSEAYCNMGCAYGGLGKYPEAIGLFEQGIKANPAYSKNYYFMGLTYRNMGDSIKAKPYFEKAASLGENNK